MIVRFCPSVMLGAAIGNSLVGGRKVRVEKALGVWEGLVGGRIWGNTGEMGQWAVFSCLGEVSTLMWADGHD